MNKLAQLNIPGYGQVDPFPNLRPSIANGNLGSIVSSLLEIVFMLAGILMFVVALAGIFQYITAGGNKEGLAKARARITWSIVGFLFVVISFALSRYIQELVSVKQVPIQSVTSPRQDCPQPLFWDPQLGRCTVR